MGAPVELDLEVGDTFLAAELDATSTSLVLGHDITQSFVRLPTPPFWAVLEPDNPSSREDVLVTAITGATATVRRNFTASPPGTGTPHKVGSRLRLASRAGAILEPFHLVGNTGEPGFAANWTNFGAGFQAAGFAMTPEGLVVLTGLVKTTASVSSPSNIFTLPVGYRPAADLVFPSNRDSTSTAAQVFIVGGVVQLRNFGGPATIANTPLSGVSFPAGA